MSEIRLSELYGKDVYNLEGKFLGRAADFVLDLVKGEIKLILFVLSEDIQKHVRNTDDPEEKKKFMKENSVHYSKVSAVGDIILVSP